MNLAVTSLLFFPEKAHVEAPADYGLAHETVQCVTADGVRLHGWYLPAKEAKATLLLLHGNGGNISIRLFKAKPWVERGVSVLLLDYRQYGKSEGTIRRETDLYDDAEAAVKWLEEKHGVTEENIVLYGESLGSAPAVELATRRRFRGLILEAPFESLRALAKLHYPWAPGFLLQDFQFKNIDKIGGIKAPLFILHGEQDAVCPYFMGKKLFDAAPEPKKMLTVPHGQHNDLYSAAGPEAVSAPHRFFFE